MNSSEIKVTVTKTPSYLYSLLGTTDDIVLIHKSNDPLMNESYEVPTPRSNKDEDFLDVTGSPLKVNLNNSSFLSTDSVISCMNLWQKSEEKHYPLPYDSAQDHIQEYINKNYKNEKRIATWWVLDGSDKDGTILLSVLQLPTSISRTVVKSQGFIPINHPTILFEELCNTHFKIVSKLTAVTQKVPLRQLTSNISSTYEISGSKITGMNFDKCDIQGSVYLEISWNQCCAEIPLDHSKSILTIQTVVGQQNSALFRFWKELILLELYVKTLNEYNSETMLNSHWLPSHGDISDESSLVDQVIETVNRCQDVPRHNINTEERVELNKIIENVDKRHTSDITDQLWITLNKCSTYGALTDCLNTVFTEIINNESSVYIADSNTTSMAQIIRDIVAEKTSVFMLTETQPIEILIDIGLEKLRKDYTYIFTQFGISTDQELRDIFNILEVQGWIEVSGIIEVIDVKNGYFGDLKESHFQEGAEKLETFLPNLFYFVFIVITETFQSTLVTQFEFSCGQSVENAVNKSKHIRSALYHKKSLLNLEDVDSRMKILGQLHTVLETLILVPSFWQVFSAKTVYDHYLGTETPVDSFSDLARNKLYEISVDLPVTKVCEYVKTLSPAIRRISLTMSKPSFSVKNVFHLSHQPIFPPVIYRPNVLHETIGDGDSVFYYYTLLTEITNFIKRNLV